MLLAPVGTLLVGICFELDEVPAGNVFLNVATEVLEVVRLAAEGFELSPRFIVSCVTGPAAGAAGEGFTAFEPLTVITTEHFDALAPGFSEEEAGAFCETMGEPIFLVSWSSLGLVS